MLSLVSCSPLTCSFTDGSGFTGVQQRSQDTAWRDSSTDRQGGGEAVPIDDGWWRWRHRLSCWFCVHADGRAAPGL